MTEDRDSPSGAGLEPLPFDQLGDYEILGELGQGSMATLYLGRRRGIGGFERLFAIKVIHDHLGRKPAFVEMLLNEARIAARIQHPNVVPTYDIAVDRGRHFMAMDYISGETYASLLRATWSAGRPLPIPIAVHILARVSEGLHAAHELTGSEGVSLGVVHRDLAPQNVMIGYDGSVRVMDFGIAKAMDTISQTRPGVMKGTVAYMAPEQVRCEAMDRRVDIFALGTVLWESTVGLRLFRHDNDIGTASRILKMQIPPPSDHVEVYPAELERIVMRALQRDPEQRYQTARQLGDELQAVLTSLQETITPSRLAEFMAEIFPDRKLERRAMEQKALDPEPARALRPPAVDSGSLGLADLDLSISVDLDEPSSSAGPQARIPTMVIRQRALPTDPDAPEEQVSVVGESLIAIPSGAPKLGEPTPSVEPSFTVLGDAETRPLPDEELVPRDPAVLPFEVESDTLDADVAAAISRPKLVPALIAALGALVLLGLWWRPWATEPPENPAKVAAAEPARVDPPAADLTRADPPTADLAFPPPVQTASAAQIRIEVLTQPASATVRLDGKVIDGPTTVVRDDETHLVRVSAEGHTDLSRVIVADQDQVLQVELTPLPVVAPTESPRVKKRRRRAKKPTPKEDAPLLFGGDDL